MGGSFILLEIIEVLTLVIAHQRGHEIYWDGYIWRYTDNGHLFDDRRPCIKCGRMPTPDGYDPCLGYIEGATAACCGHGVEEPYTIYSVGSDLHDVSQTAPDS
jgi:hypothetical protein